MLVLSRKIGERIHIGDNITIEIRRVAGNRVTLALEAPRTVRILRGELEKAAREFREPETGEATQTATFEVDAEQLKTFDEPTTGDTTSGPEPYAVIHRRLHVVPDYSPAPVSSDFAL
jgi:carbon storage regulator CsrA